MPWTNEDEYLLCGDISPKINSDWLSTHSTKTLNLVPPKRGDLVTTSVKGGQQSPLIHTVLSEKQFAPRTSPSPWAAEFSKTVQSVTRKVWNNDIWKTVLRPVPNVVLLPCRTQMNLARKWHDDSTAAVWNVEPNTIAPYVIYANNA